MNKQVDLEGNETNVTEEKITKLTKRFIADIFYMTVSESAQDSIDKFNEEKDIVGKRRWVARNMKVKNPKLLRAESEEDQFQTDLEKLIKVI